MTDQADLKKTPLYDVHVAAGARMVPFAGYLMPVQYSDGVLKEHLWTREHAGLFDVSHMGQARL
ncbi:MAG: glycine cleavage system protein T, partial [Caulobacteraceae bacterium]